MKTVLVAHPSAELYGSDRMALESVRALVTRHRVVVALPTDGPLVAALQRAGAVVEIVPASVLRREALRPTGFLRFGADSARSLRPIHDVLRRHHVDALYVNTVVLPLWPVAGKAMGIPTLCHVHEAESISNPIVRAGFFAPLRCVDLAVFNSRVSASMVDVLPRRVVYNGVAGPPTPPAPPRPAIDSTLKLVQVGRLSARKGTDVAVRAVRLLADRGVPVHLTLVGDSFAGNEPFERALRTTAGDNVTFVGHRTEVWDSFAEADVALVPSRLEPFGNVAVEAMLCRRIVVASATEGLTEIVADGRTGVLVEPGNALALANAIQDVRENWSAVRTVVDAAHDEARHRFTLERYHRDVLECVDQLLRLHVRSAA
ncbi:glycosyltransferase family 4 protein [Rhodococcoides corynebacterioides]|uniref:glycosyltransferase family 4 protein n=1 Tax=Rhodococcoides corynebacterioides TaxID=53972 RepID=UPI001C9BA9A5|nr:glycosyltransferase family 4 protein [Rhodococcus corynebacterioides]